MIGAAEPEDRAAWEALVCRPGGAEAWQAAVVRRSRIDTVAAAIRGRPWLARAIHHVSRMSRRIGPAPQGNLSLVFPDAPLAELSSMMLGPAEEDIARTTRPAWGQILPIHLQVGVRVTVEVPPELTPVGLRYLCNGEEGALPTRTWELESGEAPVLLLVLVGTTSDRPLSETVSEVSALAGVLLLEEG